MLNDGPRGMRMITILSGMALFAEHGIEPNGTAYKISDVVRRDLVTEVTDPDQLTAMWADYTQDEIQWDRDNMTGDNVRLVLERWGWESRLRTGEELFERWCEGEPVSVMVPPVSEDAPEPPIRGGRRMLTVPVTEMYYASFDRGDGDEEGWVMHVEYPDVGPQACVLTEGMRVVQARVVVPQVSVKIENTYACGRQSEAVVLMPAPTAEDDMDEWWHEVPSGDGHSCGATEHAMYECTIIDAPHGFSHLIGINYTTEG